MSGPVNRAANPPRSGPSRPLPDPDAVTAFFWESAREGRLRILRCAECGTFIHPPRPICRACRSRNLAPQDVTGRGTVHSYTVTHVPLPGFEPPFAVVLVELEEQRGVRLVSNLVDVPLADIQVGMPVEVTFERISDEVTLPQFRKRPDHSP